ncbi:MAG: sigma-70 family RNA polymerase sigma factor [Chloroflexi bacterium]|nr:sigma-70 family RNA polymerase sigma factor [Chloroflexota bacterium]
MPGNKTKHEIARDSLHLFLREHSASLQGIISTYIVRMRLAQGDAVQTLATEVLSETTLEALRHADRFDPATQPRAWLLSIATNVLKRKKASLMKRHYHEVLLSDLASNFHSNTFQEQDRDFFDQFTHLASGPEDEIEERERVDELLSLVQPGDQEILRLALVHDLDAQALSRVLQVSPGAARVRLHRALNRLRTTWKREQHRD